MAKVLPQSRVTYFNLKDTFIVTNDIHVDLEGDRSNVKYIGIEGVLALAGALAQCHVTSLNLSGCRIGSKGAEILMRALPKSKIITLNLESNSLRIKGTASLSMVLPQTKIISLNLNDNGMEDEGIKVLAQTLPQSQVSNLDLDKNDIGDEGAAALAKILPQTKIVSLNLRGKKFEDWGEPKAIGDAGTLALAQSLQHSQITSIDLSNNEIGDEGAFALARVFPQSKITNINLENNYIKTNGALAIAKTLPQSQITSLDLSRNQINAKGADVLVRAFPNYLLRSQVENVDLSDNDFVNESIDEIANMLPQSKIKIFNLSGNQIQAEGASVLAKSLPQSQVTNLNLSRNNISYEGARALAEILPQSKLTSIDLEDNSIGLDGVIAIANALSQSQITYLNLSGNEIKDAGASALARVLPISQITILDLSSNEIGADGLAELVVAVSQSKITQLNLGSNHIGPDELILISKMLLQSSIISLDLSCNYIGYKGAYKLAKVLPQSKITTLNLRGNELGSKGLYIIANVLHLTNVTILNLRDNELGVKGAFILAKILPKTKITSLNLRGNKIGDSGAAALFKVLQLTEISNLDLGYNGIRDDGVDVLSKVLLRTKLIELNFKDNYIQAHKIGANKIGVEKSVELLQRVKSSYSIAALDGLNLDAKQEITLNSHLAINKLLNAKPLADQSITQFIHELERNAIMYINQPNLLDDASFEKPKRLLSKADKLGSVQAVYLLGNLYLNEIGNLAKACEFYIKAVNRGHDISRLCLEIIEQGGTPDTLTLANLRINMPRRFSLNTNQEKLAKRETEISRLTETNILVSKAGISLTALNELKSTRAPIAVYVANQDYEPNDEGHLHFNQGQTVYVEDTDSMDIERNFANFIKEVLSNSFIPYNRDKNDQKRNDVGFIPYDIFLKYLQPKPREEWTAEEICNAIITPSTKPKAGEESKPYVDTLPAHQRGKAFEGYILSYARATKFSDILKSLNERFKGKNSDEVFIWIDLAGINQHAWMEMNSEEIGKILEVNLTQLFTYVSEGRLIHFDKAKPTNLSRSWCLVELLSCLKAQENTVAQTEICMNSDVQAEVLAQDLMALLDSLDSSKAQCFNPTDKIAIDEQIKRTLTYEGETDISMEVAFARLNAVVKSWLVTKFLPDFSRVKWLEQGASTIADVHNDIESQNAPLTLAYNASKAKGSDQAKNTNTKSEAKKAVKCVIA